MYVVRQDSDGPDPRFDVLRWAADEGHPEVVSSYPYAPGRPDAMATARNLAILDATRQADAETAGRAAQFVEGAR